MRRGPFPRMGLRRGRFSVRLTPTPSDCRAFRFPANPKIVEALDARRTELQAAREAARTQMQGVPRRRRDQRRRARPDCLPTARSETSARSSMTVRSRRTSSARCVVLAASAVAATGSAAVPWAAPGGRGHGFRGGPLGGSGAPTTDDAAPSSSDVSNSLSTSVRHSTPIPALLPGIERPWGLPSGRPRRRR